MLLARVCSKLGIPNEAIPIEKKKKKHWIQENCNIFFLRLLF